MPATEQAVRQALLDKHGPDEAWKHRPGATAASEAAAAGGGGGKAFEAWLRAGGITSADTEVNVQLGEFSLKKHRVQPVPAFMCRFPEFAAVFGKRHVSSRYEHILC